MANLPRPVLHKYQMSLMSWCPKSHIWMLHFEWLQTQFYESSDCPNPPLQATLPPSVWQHNLHLHGRKLKYGWITKPLLKSKGDTGVVEEPSHVKQLSLNQMCKIGLIQFCIQICFPVPYNSLVLVPHLLITFFLILLSGITCFVFL